MSEVMLTITNPVTLSSEMIDLGLNENISLVFNLTDIAELDRRATFSRQFRVPASDRNVDLFGPLFDVNYSGDFSFHRKAAATLAVDTVPVNSGHIQMLRVIIQRGEFAEFELVYYSESPDLVRAIGQKKLAELDFTALAHDIGFTEVTTGGTDWKYALTDRGQKWSQSGESGTRPVLNTAQPVYPNECTLVVRYKWLFDKILSTAGFTYSGSTLQAKLTDMWMPFVRAKENLSPVPEQSYFFKVGITADQTAFTAGLSGVVIPSMVEDYDNNGDFATNTWTAPYTGWFTFRLWCTIDPTGFPTNEQGVLYLKRTDVNSVVDSRTFLVQSTAVVNKQFTVGPVFLGENQTFQMHLGLSANLSGATTVKFSATNDPASGTGWQILAASSPVAGEPMSIINNCPDYLQIDFIRDVAKMLNLAFVPDKNVPSKINLVPLGEYFSSGTTKDWTDKLDLSKDIVIDSTTSLQKKKLTFTYKAGGDVASKFYENLGRIYGNYIVDGYTAGLTNDFINGELKVDLVLASTPCVYINESNIIVPKFVNETGDYQEPGPRALFITGQTNIAIYNDGTFAGELAAINTLNHYSADNATVTDEDLNFAPEVPQHDIIASPFNNLFNLYYRSYLNEIYSDQARVMEAFFSLDITDIFGFAFNDKIWIKDAYWRVLEIMDYGLGVNESTKMKLIKILGEVRDCAVTPVDADQDGIIEWEDFNGDPATGTQTCCERYGYVWDDDTSTCYGVAGDSTDSDSIERLNQVAQDIGPSLIGSDVAVNNQQSVISGMNVTVLPGNTRSLIVGDTMQVEENIGPVTVLGTNPLATIQGLHIGGGFPTTARSAHGEGTAQSGIIILSANGEFSTSGGEVLLSVIGESGNHIELPNNTTATVRLDVVIHEFDKVTGETVNYHHGSFQLLLTKTGDIAGTEDVETICQFGNFGTIDVVVDTTTNTLEHRIKISSTGGSYPVRDLRMTATFNYTQTRNPLPTEEFSAYSSGFSEGFS